MPDGALITQVNYFGTVDLVAGVKHLLARRRGSVVLVSSNSAPMNKSPEFIDLLLADQHPEAEVMRFGSLDLLGFTLTDGDIDRCSLNANGICGLCAFSPGNGNQIIKDTERILLISGLFGHRYPD